VKKTARVLITKECHRHCPQCCNNYPQIMAAMRPIYRIADLRGYENIVITGGEPLLFPEYTAELITDLFLDARVSKDAWAHKTPRIYLYTTLWHPCLNRIYAWLDGVTFTLHSGAGTAELMDFDRTQLYLLGHRHLSGRAVIYPHNRGLTIIPDAWQRLEVKDYCTEAELLARNPGGIGADEDLLYLSRGVHLE
jgi:hypothetical protein